MTELATAVQHGLRPGWWHRLPIARDKVDGLTTITFHAAGHAIVEVDQVKQRVSFRLPEAATPYQVWTMEDFLAMSPDEVAEQYL
jgi:hypothetical protein